MNKAFWADFLAFSVKIATPVDRILNILRIPQKTPALYHPPLPVYKLLNQPSNLYTARTHRHNLIEASPANIFVS